MSQEGHTSSSQNSQRLHKNDAQATRAAGGSQASSTDSKQDTIAKILEDTHPGMGNHSFMIHNLYMVCQGCGCRLLKNAAKEKLVALAETQCWNEAWAPPSGWQGHATHQMWRRAKLVSCIGCKARAVATEKGWMASKTLKTRCGGAAEALTLPACFKAKTA